MKTQKNQFQAWFALLLIGFVAMTSCDASNDPEPVTVPDELTSISLSFIAPDGTAHTFLGLNGGGTELIRLKKNIEYDVVVKVMAGTEDVTEAIKKAGSKYQLFLIDGGDAETTFLPQDDIGLAAVFKSGPAADCKLNIILVEDLDKNSSVAKGNVREGAGGTDKIFVQSDMIIVD